ncbi:MAG: sigma-54 dependent transcriptional regulator [Bacteroidaceae bacterium]|nr:sigma-54 dependent transcriptional regulator [Bacteroidaceae bacterium]
MDLKKLQSIKMRYGIVGNCDALNHALYTALQVAATDLSVLITGESGVGKEIIPRVIHDHSDRSSKKYFAINCGSIPEGTIDSELFGHEKGAFTGAVAEHEGYFGAANFGTLFLDEVGELPLSTQARLLRVLETGEYIRVGSSEVRKTDVRIVAATNVNIQAAIRDRKFREDLFYRLNTIPIKMPPLRERGDDIILLFKKFAMETARKYGVPDDYLRLSPEAEEIMKRYKWPGNIRQLKNLTEQMSILMRDSRVVTPEILSSYEVWPTTEERALAVREEDSRAEDRHSYQQERQIIFQMLNALHQEISDLRQRLDSDNDVSPSKRSVPIPSSVSSISDNTTPADSREHLTIISHHDVSERANAAYAEEYVEEPLSIDEQEKKLIIRALERSHGKRKKAAEELHISERTLYRKLKEYGLDDKI